MKSFGNVALLALLAAPATADDWRAALAALPPAPPPAHEDWLIEAPARTAAAFRQDADTLILDNGLIRRSLRLSPNAACVGFDQLTTGAALLRGIRSECRLTLDGRTYDVGGLTGQPIGNYLAPSWLAALKADPAAFQFTGFTTAPVAARFGWTPRREWIATGHVWPPKGIHLTLHFDPPAGAGLDGVQLDVHYELYDGLPLLCKWFTLHNRRAKALELQSFVSEQLALVEADSEVEEQVRPRLPNLHVETDCTVVAMSGRGAQRQSVHWLPDPTFTTQVNYRLQTPCLLECRPPLGPGVLVQPQDTFESFRTWILAFDSTDDTRQTLSLCRMYRTIAPWVQENPLIFHVRSAEPAAVRAAIDQAAEVGFELVLMTFGSGFDIEDVSEENLQKVRELVDSAHARGVALGGYSLLASRSINPETDIIDRETGQPNGFATFGASPCLASQWGVEYFRKLYRFLDMGLDALEHDGSYPGDPCASAIHRAHRGYDDSYWNQREIIVNFYRWCRANGKYLNVPDWYILNGSNKTGMGYRETNWSLPRALQEIIERQNLYDGTRFKTPTMGWMFVPLTEYHGGGPAATIEPLAEHLDHYQRRLANLLGAGVQACWRGPRLFDTPQTRAMVRAWVDFYKRHRAILDSDIVGLRRADGRDWDGILHVNPALDECGLAMLYNPLDEPIHRRIRLPLYYTGLRDTARVRIGEAVTAAASAPASTRPAPPSTQGSSGGLVDEAPPMTMALDRRFDIEVEVRIAPRGHVCVIVEKPRG